MLIDLRELLSGSQDEKSYKADIEMNTFNTGSSDYDIIDKPAVDVIIKKLGKNKLSIKADSYVTLSIPCDRCLEPVDTRVDYTVDEIVDFNDNASEEEAKEEKDYIDGYDLDVDKLVFGEILISMPGKTLCKEDCKGCPKNKSSKARRDKRRANWKMSAPNLVKCSKCGALMMPHRVCKSCGSYNKKEIVTVD